MCAPDKTHRKRFGMFLKRTRGPSLIGFDHLSVETDLHASPFSTLKPWLITADLFRDARIHHHRGKSSLMYFIRFIWWDNFPYIPSYHMLASCSSVWVICAVTNLSIHSSAVPVPSSWVFLHHTYPRTSSKASLFGTAWVCSLHEHRTWAWSGSA